MKILFYLSFLPTNAYGVKNVKLFEIPRDLNTRCARHEKNRNVNSQGVAQYFCL